MRCCTQTNSLQKSLFPSDGSKLCLNQGKATVITGWLGELGQACLLCFELIDSLLPHVPRLLLYFVLHARIIYDV